MPKMRGRQALEGEEYLPKLGRRVFGETTSHYVMLRADKVGSVSCRNNEKPADVGEPGTGECSRDMPGAAWMMARLTGH